MRANVAERNQAIRVAAAAVRYGVTPLVHLARRAIRDFSAIQRTWELQSLLGEVRRLAPRVVVEIGTHKGGTLSCWPSVAHAAAHLVSIDMVCERTGLGARREDLARVRPLLRPTQALTAISGNSHDAGTLEQLRTALAGAPIDVLWIDGDHSYAGVKQDLAMYGPLVRPGGLIALHDIHGSSIHPDSQSHVFWEEIKAQYRTRQFIAQPAPGFGMGIGIIFVETLV